MVEAASSRVRPRVTEDMLDQPGSSLWPRMEAGYVFKPAVPRFPEVIRATLAHNGCTTADLDLLIPHQANLRISQLVAMGLELPEEKVFNNIQRYGNTTAASIPIALHEAVQEGRVRPGALVCLAALGAGFTWRAAPGPCASFGGRAGNGIDGRLHRQLGFKAMGVRRGYYGPGKEAMVMERRLGGR